MNNCQLYEGEKQDIFDNNEYYEEKQNFRDTGPPPVTPVNCTYCTFPIPYPFSEHVH